MEKDRKHNILNDPAIDFEGVTDNRFLTFLDDGMSQAAKFDDHVLLSRSLSRVAPMLLAVNGVPVGDRNILAEKVSHRLRSSLGPLSNSGIIRIEKIKADRGLAPVEAVKYADYPFVLSYLFAKNEIIPIIARGTIVPFYKICEKASGLWGENPRSKIFMDHIVANFVQELQLNADESRPIPVSQKIVEARNPIEELKVRTLANIPPEKDSCKEFDLDRIKQAIREVEDTFPLWKMESAEIAMNRYPLPTDIIKTALFIKSVRAEAFGKYRLSDEVAIPSDVLRSLKLIGELIPQYEAILKRKLTEGEEQDTKCTLQDTYRVAKSKVLRDLGLKIDELSSRSAS